MWAFWILHFDDLVLPKSCTVSAEKTEELSLMILKSDAKFKEKLVVSNMTQGISRIVTQPLKSLKILLQRALFVQRINVWDKKNTEELFFLTLNSVAKFE